MFYHISEPIAPGPLRDFVGMRAGALAVLPIERLHGIVTFPSFHVAAAVLLAWGARGTRWFFLSLALNSLMAVSALTEGGHYVTDAMAGAGAAILSILLANAPAFRPARRLAA